MRLLVLNDNGVLIIFVSRLRSQLFSQLGNHFFVLVELVLVFMLHDVHIFLYLLRVLLLLRKFLLQFPNGVLVLGNLGVVLHCHLLLQHLLLLRVLQGFLSLLLLHFYDLLLEVVNLLFVLGYLLLQYVVLGPHILEVGSSRRGHFWLHLHVLQLLIFQQAFVLDVLQLLLQIVYEKIVFYQLGLLLSVCLLQLQHALRQCGL